MIQKSIILEVTISKRASHTEINWSRSFRVELNGRMTKGLERKLLKLKKEKNNQSLCEVYAWAVLQCNQPGYRSNECPNRNPVNGTEKDDEEICESNWDNDVYEEYE